MIEYKNVAFGEEKSQKVKHKIAHTRVRAGIYK